MFCLAENNADTEMLTVHFLDIGQGEAAIIQCGSKTLRLFGWIYVNLNKERAINEGKNEYESLEALFVRDSTHGALDAVRFCPGGCGNQ